MQDYDFGRRPEDLVVRVVAESDLRQPVTETGLVGVEIDVRVVGAGTVRRFVIERRGRERNAAGRRIDNHDARRPESQMVLSSSRTLM